MRPCVYVTWQQASRDWVSQPRFLTDGQVLEGGGHDHDHGQEPQPRIFIRKKIRNSVHTRTASADMTTTFHLLQLFLTSFRSIGLLLMLWLAGLEFEASGDKSAPEKCFKERDFEKEERERERERERDREKGRNEERALKQCSACDMHVQPTFFSLSGPAAIILSLGHWRRNGRNGGVSSSFPLSSECQCEKQSDQ